MLLYSTFPLCPLLLHTKLPAAGVGSINLTLQQSESHLQLAKLKREPFKMKEGETKASSFMVVS